MICLELRHPIADFSWTCSKSVKAIKLNRPYGWVGKSMLRQHGGDGAALDDATLFGSSSRISTATQPQLPESNENDHSTCTYPQRGRSPSKIESESHVIRCPRLLHRLLP